ncbi:MAG: AAA family ATPase [Pyrinomonadaceae bacterium]
MTLEHNNRRFQVRHLFVMLRAFDRRIAWTPSLPEVCFEVARGEALIDRAHEALADYYRRRARQHGDGAVAPDEASLAGKAWLSFVEVSVAVPSIYTPPVQNFFALLGASEAPDGAAELERVGRSLNALYPEQLERATDREDEVAELTHLLRAVDRRPVLLVGQRLVGKTAIIHECVRRRMERRRSSEASLHVSSRGGAHDLAGDLWLIAPPRLISGMSYVGQWEGRLLAILKEAGRKRHTLYFDDPVGLFYAGQSSGSSLCVAQVLKPYVERRDVRILAEATPEALRVLQELDRSFADLFHVVPIEEPNEGKTLRTLLGYRRTLEREHRCRFDYAVLPVVIDLTRRYVADAAFPGKAATLLRTLAAKQSGREVTRSDALQEFAAKSGLSVQFLDDRAELNRADVVEALSREVVGQSAAVGACADAVTIAKARLNDARRPLASFLFLGPTGVGKTQCAKSLARYLFGDAERILRYDMNEFVSAYSVARLVGTLDAPEGLLTGAVRRTPFAVVLFDEIEKAHPAVFDLLLGVMGARLTDARGRTVDFANTIIILTSNLGVREAASELGFRQTNESHASTYQQAAEKFFRPEFFNRLTRVVPFERLRREDVRGIARRLIEDVFHRDGLVRRGVKLLVEEAALVVLVDIGYHPQLGARALKRALERQVTAPRAAQLAAVVPDEPLIISLRAPQRGGIAVDARHLTLIEERAATAPLENTDRLLDGVEDMLERITEGAEALRPPGEILVGDSSTAAHLSHFLIRDQTRRIARMCQRADERLARERHSQTIGGARNTRHVDHKKAGRRAASTVGASPASMRQRQLAKLTDVPPISGALLAEKNLHRFLQDCAAHASPYGEATTDYLQDVLREAALLDSLWSVVAADRDKHRASTRAVLTIASLDEAGRRAAARLRDLYRALFEKEFNCRIELPGAEPSGAQSARVGAAQRVEMITLDGTLAGALAPLEAGTHLFVSPDESYAPVVVRAHMADQPGADGFASDDKEVLGLPPVLRIYAEPMATLDLRTRLLATGKLGSAELRTFLLSALPPPAEFG